MNLKPKPFSIRQRFFLMQALCVVLAIWVLLTAVQVRRLTLFLFVLLVVSSLGALALLWISRRMARRHLWEPVAQIGQMVRQIRAGNLDVRAEIPRSVELGPLVDSFVHMAEELRAARQALEEKVQTQSKELDTAQRKLLEAAKLAAIGQLVSGVAHEVNNPLTSILGFAEVVLGNPSLDAATRRQLRIVRDEALRVKNVVANLSSFARRAPQQTMRINLQKVLDRVVELRGHQLAANGIQLRWEAPGQAVWVEGDPDQLLQVLFNLLQNAEQAIQAGGGPGDIRLGCHGEAGKARITVQDTGVGMKREVMERMFEPYFTTQPSGQASGLGLSIAHGIVAQHGGTITAESREDEGSVFTVLLPAASAAGDPALPNHVPSGASAPGRGRALLIDDEESILELLRSALEKRGWQTVALKDTARFESVVKETDFDLIFCDLKMPGRNGLELWRVLEEVRPDLAGQFVLMTGNLAGADAETYDLSRVTVLRKPFSLAQLDETITTIGGQGKSSRAAAHRA